MTLSLRKAFEKASQLPDAEQERLASRLLAELDDDNAFDRAITASADKLARLASEALAEHRAGLTEALRPELL